MNNDWWLLILIGCKAFNWSFSYHDWLLVNSYHLMSSSAISAPVCSQLQVSSYQGWWPDSITAGPVSFTSARLVAHGSPREEMEKRNIEMLQTSDMMQCVIIIHSMQCSVGCYFTDVFLLALSFVLQWKILVSSKYSYIPWIIKKADTRTGFPNTSKKSISPCINTEMPYELTLGTQIKLSKIIPPRHTDETQA